MRRIDEMVLDLLKDIHPLSLDVDEIADLLGYNRVRVKKCVVTLFKEGKITIDTGDKYRIKKG
jgi:DNA-binding IclR family transcriptional regulator